MADTVRRRLAVAGLLALGACAMTGPFDEATLAPVLRGEKAAVLLRFTVTAEDGRRIPPFAHMMGDDDLGLALGDFDSAGVPTRRVIAARFASEAAREEGALVLFLPPGYDYLAFQGARRADAFSYDASFRRAPRWRIAVPAGERVIYAGSVRLRARAITRLFGDVVIGAIDHAATVVEDDAAWARMAAARDLPGLPPPVTRLAVPHAGPVLLGLPPR